MRSRRAAGWSHAVGRRSDADCQSDCQSDRRILRSSSGPWIVLSHAAPRTAIAAHGRTVNCLKTSIPIPEWPPCRKRWSATSKILAREPKTLRQSLARADHDRRGSPRSTRPAGEAGDGCWLFAKVATNSSIASGDGFADRTAFRLGNGFWRSSAKSACRYPHTRRTTRPVAPVRTPFRSPFRRQAA